MAVANNSLVVVRTAVAAIVVMTVVMATVDVTTMITMKLQWQG